MMGTLAVHVQPFFQWLLRSTLQAGLIVCLILLLQAVFRNKLGVRWHHALWLILVIRMVLPWAPQSRLSVFNVVARWDQPHESHSSLIESPDPPPAISSTGSSTKQSTGSGAATNPDGQPKNIDRTPKGSQKSEGAALHSAHRTRDVLPLVWLMGAMALGAYVVGSNARLWRATSIEHPSTDKDVLELLEECRARMGLRTIVALVTSEKVNTPVLLGFIRPRLLIPRDIAKQLGQEELRYVFLHELAHVKRHDIALAWLTALLQVLHWFNPLVWLAFHRMRCDRELACDALVLTRTQGEGTKDYGRAIVSLLERFSFPPPLPGLAGILENKSQLKRRIAMITQFQNNSYRWSPLAVALIVVLCCVSLPNARSGKAAETSATKPTGASVSGEQPAAPLAGENNVFVDPETGIKFTKFRAISGPRDVMTTAHGALSPNGKFLLWWGHVIPLDGGLPFDFVDISSVRSESWSPDGRNVVFYAGALWLIQVDPETARPVGSARKLLEVDRPYDSRWSPDSKRIVFRRNDSQIRDEIWTLSIETGELSKVTDPFDVGLVSPDGRMIACSEGQGLVDQNALLVKPVAGGEAKKITGGVYPVAWSADSKWIVCKPRVGGGWGDRLRFVRLADGREVDVIAPGYMITPSPQGGKLVFFHCSYDGRTMLKVISTAGGPATEFGWPTMSFASMGYQLWAGDSRTIFVKGERKGAGWGLWAISLDGKDPRLLALDAPPCPPSPRGGDLWLFSPDGSKLLLSLAPGNGGTRDLWVMPVSLSQMRSNGPAVKVFGGQVPSSGVWTSDMELWSPDGKRIAFAHKGSIWVASADGKTVTQLTKEPPPNPLTSEWGNWPDWSPDGTMIAFCTQSWATGHVLVRVVPAAGGEARVITDLPPRSWAEQRFYAWSPDGKELTIVKEGVISNFPISGGDAKVVLHPEDMGIWGVGWLRWSPDGRALGFRGGSTKIYVYQPNNGKLERLDSGVQEPVAPWYWSPDSKWVSFLASQTVKTRPESVLWEMDVEEAVAKLAK